MSRQNWTNFWFKHDSNYLKVKLKVFRKVDKFFWLKQNLIEGDAGFNQYLRLRKQLIVAAKILSREIDLWSVHMPTISRDFDDQLKLAHEVIVVSDCSE